MPWGHTLFGISPLTGNIGLNRPWSSRNTEDTDFLRYGSHRVSLLLRFFRFVETLWSTYIVASGGEGGVSKHDGLVKTFLAWFLP